MYLGEFIKKCDDDTTLDIKVRNDEGKFVRIATSTPSEIANLLKIFGSERALDYCTSQIESFYATTDGRLAVVLETGHNEG